MTPGPTNARVVVAGSLNLDLIVVVPRLPIPGETVAATGRHDGPGGKGLNQAVAAARAGAPTAFVGCLGDDDAGRRLLDALVAEGIDTSAVRIEPGVASGVALVAVDESGANSIVVVPGANSWVQPGEVGAVAVGGHDVLVAQGEIPPAATLAFLQAGRQVGARTILNLAPFHPPSPELLRAASIVVVNETELLDLVGAMGPPSAGEVDAAPVDGRRVVEGARKMIELGVEALLVTLGGAGMVAVSASGVVAEPGRKVPVVDTTGAGDAVVGVLAAELAAGAELSHAMRVAGAAASVVVGRRGAASAMPARSEIDAALE
jgi:ribokinase